MRSQCPAAIWAGESIASSAEDIELGRLSCSPPMARTRKAGYSLYDMSNASAKTPLLISLALVGIGLIFGLVGGITSGSIPGGIIAGLGAIPAAWAAWSGMQQETQSGLAGAVVMLTASLGVGGLLIVLGVINLFF